MRSIRPRGGLLNEAYHCAHHKGTPLLTPMLNRSIVNEADQQVPMFDNDPLTGIDLFDGRPARLRAQQVTC